MKYKSFRIQFIECGKNGTRFSITCVRCNGEETVCSKYRKRCSSSVCLGERIGVKNET